MAQRFIQVILNVPSRQLFDYRVTASDNISELVGRRVLVPFGTRLMVGLVLSFTDTPSVEEEKVKEIKQVFSDMPALPLSILQLIRFCFDYYHAPWGMIYQSVLPSFFRRSKSYSAKGGYRIVTGADLTLLKKKQQAIANLLLVSGPLTKAQIEKNVPTCSTALRQLIKEAIVESCHYEPPSVVSVVPSPPDLSAKQQQAIAQLKLESCFSPHLLFGATGSGKTEVYLHAIEKIVKKGYQALVLIPEIHLTPQMEQDFKNRFPNYNVCVLHSQMSDGDRVRNWLRASSGDVDILIGTRLAVFTPFAKLGLIVVDEEHDESYKQTESSFSFSARDIALWRAKNESVPIILGSATPSLETVYTAQKKQWTTITLSQRIVKSSLNFSLIEESENLYHGIATESLHAISSALKAQQQVLIFINRRGYAPVLFCRDCNRSIACFRCSAYMTVYQRQDELRCHLCSAVRPIPHHCSSCGNGVIALGSGTQRIEEALLRLYPHVPSLRLDSDSMTNLQFKKQRQAVMSGDIQLLIGTQILAKGHNFPRLGLIVVLNTDNNLLTADFRTEERLFSLLSQVVGRGTRNPNGCRILIQTKFPQHPFYSELMSDKVELTWERLLKERKLASMPPFSYLGLLRAKHKNKKQLQGFMKNALLAARKLSPAHVQIFDAVPENREKVSHWYRHQILIRSQKRTALHAFLNHWMKVLPRSTHWMIEVDPINI